MINVNKNLGFLGCLVLLAGLVSCNKQAVVSDRPSFSADSAYTYIEKQMDFGPRVPNSAAHTQCAVWLIEQLRAFGAEVELQKGFMPDYRGHDQQIYNIIGHFYTPETASRKRILLGAHYDTRPWSDEEEEYSDRFYNVPGANDGASGVGVLLEVARQLGLRMEDSTFRTPVDIIFFDVEDMGTPRTYTGMEREDTWCLGSQLWSKNYLTAKRSNSASGLTSHSEAIYQFGIILDMVGAPDASFPKEMYSSHYAANYQQQIWRSAEQLGYSELFNNQQSYPITDDHYYINVLAGIPCVDIIHYDIRNATGFASWWHTRRDDMSNISRSTLQGVGEVVMSQL